jgi:hypothetical protein
MRRDQYVVVQRNSEWWTILDGTRFGPYQTKQEAAEAAVSQAKISEHNGQSADVSYEEADGDPLFYSSPQED